MGPSCDLQAIHLSWKFSNQTLLHNAAILPQWTQSKVCQSLFTWAKKAWLQKPCCSGYVKDRCGWAPGPILCTSPFRERLGLGEGCPSSIQGTFFASNSKSQQGQVRRIVAMPMASSWRPCSLGGAATAFLGNNLPDLSPAEARGALTAPPPAQRQQRHPSTGRAQEPTYLSPSLLPPLTSGVGRMGTYWDFTDV